MATQPNLPQEEIDLGSLFSQIGKGFSNLFNSIGNLFKSIFHYVISLLLFIRKNAIIIGTTTIIGFAIGLFLEKTNEPVYTSEMLIETNYKSGNRLYNQIDYINSLITEADSVKISKLFNISPKKANEILSIDVEATDANKEALIAYDIFMKHTDTIYTRGFSLADYKKKNNEQDLRFHTIKIVGLYATSFEGLENGFINLVQNDYYKGLKNRKQTELKFIKEEITTNIFQLDSLRKQYRDVALLQANKDQIMPEVSVSTRSDRKQNFDMDLYDMSAEMLFELEKINTKIEKSEVLAKVKSSFNDGVLVDNISSKKWFKYGVFGFLLALLTLLGLKFNKYLSKYEKENI